MDQIAARAFERGTQLGSLQMTADENSLLGSCDLGYSCAYSSTISWLTPTLPLMAENNPRVLFERMFGSSDSTDARVRAAAAEVEEHAVLHRRERIGRFEGFHVARLLRLRGRDRLSGQACAAPVVVNGKIRYSASG